MNSVLKVIVITLGCVAVIGYVSFQLSIPKIISQYGGRYSLANPEGEYQLSVGDERNRKVDFERILFWSRFSNKKLAFIFIYSYDGKDLDLNNFKYLRNVNIGSSESLNRVKLDELTSLKVLSIEKTPNLDSLLLPDMGLLDTLNIKDTKISMLDLRKYSSLVRIEAKRNSSLTRLVLPKFPSLNNVYIDENVALRELINMEFQSNIEVLRVEQNDILSRLNVERSTALASLIVYDNANLEMIKLPELSFTREVIINKNPKLTQLALKGFNNWVAKVGITIPEDFPAYCKGSFKLNLTLQEQIFEC